MVIFNGKWGKASLKMRDHCPWPQGHSKENISRSKCWWGCRQHKIRSLLGEYKWVQPLWKSTWRYLTKVACAFLRPSNPLKSICPRVTPAHVHPETWTGMFRATLLAMMTEQQASQVLPIVYNSRIGIIKHHVFGDTGDKPVKNNRKWSA